MNQYTIKDKILLSLFRKVIDKLKDTKYFNKLDLIWDYNNIWIKKEDKWKATVICKSTCLETTSPQWNHFRTIQACLLWQPPFSQHVSWWCYNPPDIPSSTAEILLFNSVFHDGVAPVSVSTLKPLLRTIGVLPLKLRASPILSLCI